ncbi:hypothetical protein C2E23DRAFT_288045 [Lenzites betulinus]|nr:hypothetical protein C2E23DRAFT_288045 [Lenzites betulinus]
MYVYTDGPRPARRALASSLLHTLDPLPHSASAFVFPPSFVVPSLSSSSSAVLACVIYLSPPCSPPSFTRGWGVLSCVSAFASLPPPSLLRTPPSRPSRVSATVTSRLSSSILPPRPAFPSCPYPVRIRLRTRTEGRNARNGRARALFLPACSDSIVSLSLVSSPLSHTCLLPPSPHPPPPLCCESVPDSLATVHHCLLLFKLPFLFIFILLFSVSIPFVHSLLGSSTLHPRSPYSLARTHVHRSSHTTNININTDPTQPPYPVPR